MEESLHLPVQLGEGLTGTVWQTGEMLVIPDYDQWSARLGGFSYGTLGSVIGVPLLSGSRVLGVLVIGSASGSPHHFDPAAIEILNQFARLATVAVQNARLFSNLKAELSERKQAEQKLLESTERLKEAQRTTHIGDWELNLVNNHLIWSDEIYRIFEIDPEKFGASYEAFLEAVHPDDRDAVNRAYTSSLETKVPYTIDHRLLMPDGRVKHVHERSETIYAVEGHPLRSVGTVQDITERKRAEEDRIAREIAERANRAKSEFLSRMSHELRTPLNAILGFAQLLKMDELKPNQARGVEQIYKSGRHLLNLVNQVLDIARIEAGKLHISPEPVRLADVVKEAIELIRPLADARHLSLSLEIPSSSDLFVQADHQSLRQVLLNLLSNAVKYNREGGDIAITASLTIDGYLRLQVRDSGEGIPPDKMKRLFIPFDRLGKELVEQEGTGLGLALSKGLVEAMGGRIGAESKPGEGSVFWLELRLDTDSLEE